LEIWYQLLIYGSLPLPAYCADRSLRSVPVELAHANPPRGSELFASRALWGGQFLRSTASAEHWRQEGASCKSLPLTSTDPELAPLQSQHRWISVAFKSDISGVPWSGDSIGRRR